MLTLHSQKAAMRWVIILTKKGDATPSPEMPDCWCIQWILRISDADRGSGKTLCPMSLSSQFLLKIGFASKSDHMHFCFISAHQVFSWKPWLGIFSLLQPGSAYWPSSQLLQACQKYESSDMYLLENVLFC